MCCCGCEIETTILQNTSDTKMDEASEKDQSEKSSKMDEL